MSRRIDSFVGTNLTADSPTRASEARKALPARSPLSGVQSKPRSRLVVVASVAVVIVLVFGAYLFLETIHKPGSSSVSVLVPKDTLFSIPGSQFNAIAFTISSNSVIEGTFYDTFGIIVYTLTPSELDHLAKTGLIPSYEWTSGKIANSSVEILNLNVSAGAWDLAFVNPNELNTTLVGFYTELTLGPA